MKLMINTVHYLLPQAETVGLSQLFQNNFGNNRLRLELENYSSLMGQNCVYKDYKRSKRCKREVQVIAGLGDIKTVYLTCVQVD